MCIYNNNNGIIVIDIGHRITNLSVYLYFLNLDFKRDILRHYQSICWILEYSFYSLFSMSCMRSRKSLSTIGCSIKSVAPARMASTAVFTL